MPNSGNPALMPSQFRSQFEFVTRSDAMTVNGAIAKTGILTALMIASGGVGWVVCQPGSETVTEAVSPELKIGLIIGSMIGTLICGVALFFSQRLAPFLSPVYAVCEGMLLGAISSYFSRVQHGIVVQAVLLTVGLLLVMLLAYASGVIRATPMVTKMICLATGAVGLTYLVSMVASLVGHPIPYIHQGGTIGIGFSVVVVGIAAFNFILDFDMIESAARAGSPKYMEWYAAYGLLVTLAWLYLEVLRLLMKMNSNDNRRSQ